MEHMHILITYRDNRTEDVLILNFTVSGGCLILGLKEAVMRFIPIDLIKEWQVIK
jgi:hypothetical protein